MIEVRNLSKIYGRIGALKGISASIDEGEIVGLLGPNGAGKTTTMKILTGFLLPTSGSAFVAGFDVAENPIEVQKRIGYLPENAPIYHDQLARDYLSFIASMRGLSGAGARTAIARASALCGVDEVQTRPIGELSKGYRQRVGLAATILHDPEILILDEPTNGLDPNQIVEVRNLIRSLGRDKTVIVSSHILAEIEATCERAIVVHEGSIQADGAISDLTRVSIHQLTVEAPRELAVAAFGAIASVSRVEVVSWSGDQLSLRLHLSSSAEVTREVWAIARDKNWPIVSSGRAAHTLEEVFRLLTREASE